MPTAKAREEGRFTIPRKGVGLYKTLQPGGYALAAAGMNHYAFTARETTIVLYGQGPVEFKYVNPADDPRTPKKTWPSHSAAWTGSSG